MILWTSSLKNKPHNFFIYQGHKITTLFDISSTRDAKLQNSKFIKSTRTFSWYENSMPGFDAPGQDLTEFCNNLSALRDLNELICDWDIQCPWICNLEPAKSYSLSSRYKAGLWTNIQEQGAC